MLEEMLVPPGLLDEMLEPSPDATPMVHRRDLKKRHYKKDSRFVGDLYTLTFDTHEDLESLGYLDLQRRNDRETIRRKLAMGPESDEPGAPALAARAGRKPSLQSRLQGGMNLQICFMNETASDEEDEDELGGAGGLLARRTSGAAQPEPAAFQSLPVDLNDWPKFSQPPAVAREAGEPARTADFVRHQAQLQTEARLALAQAKQMARMQMEIERQSRKSPISDVVRLAFQKIGVPFPDGRRRVSRQLLTEMNIAQLQVIVNDFHTRIEGLNEALVRYLMERDEQHMEQDSKLVHIEDLTSYFGQKHQEAVPEPPAAAAATAAADKRKPRAPLRVGMGRAK
ncbi:schwannomin-interacting protein 1-like isoform X2 [Pollicipes pollicipes]|uniref:schwannomin-interacting protein 1-like isoform X2 n=1 Tax=Pollicipes pollicipes TaxID=41117 RepID=UPI0018853E12|nr:schwannomin-interacting protein 1-like isoform X2 [Pollicipes pollicipes]